MAAYLIVNYQLDDRAGYDDYRSHSPAQILGVGNGATLVARDPETTALEGDPGHQTVMIRYDTKEQALERYRSGAYQAVLGKRLDASSKHFAIVVDAID